MRLLFELWSINNRGSYEIYIKCQETIRQVTSRIKNVMYTCKINTLVKLKNAVKKCAIVSKKPLVKKCNDMNSTRNTRKLRRHKNVHNKSILWHDGQNSHYRVVEWSAGCLHSYLSISNWKQWSSLLREYQTSPPGRINEFLTAGSAALH